jgi:hypothetical protein
MSVAYEWDVETVSDGDTEALEDGEVVDHDHSATYKEALASSNGRPPSGFRFEIVLVRDDDEGRSWACLDDGQLPTHFVDAYGAQVAKVPKRFFREVDAGRPLLGGGFFGMNTR